VTIRGTYGTGYRAPSIGELYGGQAESSRRPATRAANLPAPPNCGAAAGNGDDRTSRRRSWWKPNLQPEVHVVDGRLRLRATFVKNLTITATTGPTR